MSLVVIAVLRVVYFLFQDAYIKLAVVNDPVTAMQRPANVGVNVEKSWRGGPFFVLDAMHSMCARGDQAAWPKALTQQRFAIRVDHGDFDEPPSQVCCFRVPDHKIPL